MRYLTAGAGPPLVLIHGLMGFSFSWTENFAGLAKHFTVYAPDLFNAGRSERFNQDGSLDTAARSIVAFMDALELKQVNLVGSSHGGTLVMLVLAMHPVRVQKVVACAPATRNSEEGRWQARLFSTWFGGLAGHCVPYLAPVVNGYFVARMYADPARILPGTVQGYNAPLKVPGTVKYLLKVMRSWFEEYRNLDGRLEALDDSRLVLLWGREDRVVPIAHMDELRGRYRRARFIVMENAGHLPYEEAPERFNQAILQALNA